VATIRMAKKTKIPVPIPMAKKAKAIAVGIKIPKPRKPIRCLAAATKLATRGKSKNKIIVFSETPLAMA
jgi:hypothetical protein